MNGAANLDRLIDGVSARHDDEDIDITVGMGNAVGMGAEKNDSVGLESFRDLGGESPNDAHGHISSAIEADRHDVRIADSRAHGAIVYRREFESWVC